VVDLEGLITVVASPYTGGVGRTGLMRVSLHHVWPLQLDACRPTLWRGTGGGDGLREGWGRLLRRDLLRDRPCGRAALRNSHALRRLEEDVPS